MPTKQSHNASLAVALCLLLVAPVDVSKLSGYETKGKSDHNLHCPPSFAGGQPRLPPSIHMVLSAEPKSGTTWLQLLVESSLYAICHEYDTAVEGLSCSFSCGDQAVPFVNASLNNSSSSSSSSSSLVDMKCNDLVLRLRDSRTGEASEVRASAHQKHTIPFVGTQADKGHPNTTPILSPLPSWLQACIDRRQYRCTPPPDVVQDTLELGPAQQQQMELVINSTRRSSCRHFHSSGGHAHHLHDDHDDDNDDDNDDDDDDDDDDTTCLPDEALRNSIALPPVGVYSIVRDPRAVVMSAANFLPGRALFGTKWQMNAVSGTPLADEFAYTQINATVGWTQFRYQWLKNVVGHIFPVYQTFYQDLHTNTVTELGRLAHFFGLCYTKHILQQVAHSNTQQAYRQTGRMRVKNVPMTRFHSLRPRDIINGYSQEMSAVALGACNQSMLQALQPSLLHRWLGINNSRTTVLQMPLSSGPYPTPHVDALRACCGTVASMNNSNYWADGHCYHGTAALQRRKKPRRPVQTDEQKAARKKEFWAGHHIILSTGPPIPHPAAAAAGTNSSESGIDDGDGDDDGSSHGNEGRRRVLTPSEKEGESSHKLCYKD